MNSDVYELDLKSDYGSYTIEYDYNKKKRKWIENCVCITFIDQSSYKKFQKTIVQTNKSNFKKVLNIIQNSICF